MKNVDYSAKFSALVVKLTNTEQIPVYIHCQYNKNITTDILYKCTNSAYTKNKIKGK